MSPSLLHPHLVDDAAALRAQWQQRRSLRIERFLADDVALALRDATRTLPMVLHATPTTGFAYTYWAYAIVPEVDCDHVVCHVGRCMWGEARAWLTALTGLDLQMNDDGQLAATLYTRGSFLHPHVDFDHRRTLAFVLGLTDDAWPAEDGGWLEFLRVDGARVEAVERRAPGWNTLDIFDVTAPILHEVPILTRNAERRTLTGWYM